MMAKELKKMKRLPNKNMNEKSGRPGNKIEVDRRKLEPNTEENGAQCTAIQTGLRRSLRKRERE